MAASVPVGPFAGDLATSADLQSGTVAFATTTTCTESSSVTGPTGANQAYIEFSFTNDTGADACVSVDYTAAEADVLVAAYLGSFNPVDPTTNLLGGPATNGTSCGGQSGSFSVLVPAGQAFVIVVSQCHLGSPSSFEFTLDTQAAGGTSAPPQIEIVPSSMDFGSVQVGAFKDLSLTVTNSAPAEASNLTIGSLSKEGTNAADFSLSNDTCSNASVAPGDSCSVLVTFLPQARGARAATVVVPNDATAMPQTVSLSGTGVAPVGQVSPTSIDFGIVNVGTTSGRQTVTITNAGDAGQSLVFSSAVFSGANASDFALVRDGCVASGAVLTAGQSCTMELTFTPGASGPRSATLTISDNGLGSPHTVSLTGTGGVPSADLAVSIAASPNAAKSGKKVTYTITVFNAGPSTATSLLVNDSLSSQSTFVSATINQGSCVTPVKGASGVVSCSFASLASGASQPIQIVVTVIAKKTSITNTVTVSAATIDPNLANNTAAITTLVK